MISLLFQYAMCIPTTYHSAFTYRILSRYFTGGYIKIISISSLICIGKWLTWQSKDCIANWGAWYILHYLIIFMIYIWGFTYRNLNWSLNLICKGVFTKIRLRQLYLLLFVLLSFISFWAPLTARYFLNVLDFHL